MTIGLMLQAIGQFQNLLMLNLHMFSRFFLSSFNIMGTCSSFCIIWYFLHNASASSSKTAPRMTLHEVSTPFKNNISECESKQVHNVIIFSLTRWLCMKFSPHSKITSLNVNPNRFTMSSFSVSPISLMAFWISQICTSGSHWIWKWQVLKHLIVLAIQEDNTVVGSSIIFMIVPDLATMVQCL